MPPHRHSMAQIALFLAIMANAAGQSFPLVVPPPLARASSWLHEHPDRAILSASAHLLMIAAPTWGYLTECVGRRPVLVIALTGAMLAPLAFGSIVGRRLDEAVSSALAFSLFFAARPVQTLLSAGLLPASQAYVADITVPEVRAGGVGVFRAAYGARRDRRFGPCMAHRRRRCGSGLPARFGSRRVGARECGPARPEALQRA